MSKQGAKGTGIPTYKFKDSYTLEQPENYEVEIEYIGPKDDSISILDVKKNLLQHVQNTLLVLKNTDTVLDRIEESKVLKDLKNTVTGFKRYQYLEIYNRRLRILNEYFRKTILRGRDFGPLDQEFFGSLKSLDRDDVPLEDI